MYLRLIGDRTIHEKGFGRIQIDRVLGMQKWAGNIKAVEDERIKLAIIAANNHYARFVMLGLSYAKWEEVGIEEEQYSLNQSHDLKQRSLSDFMS